MIPQEKKASFEEMLQRLKGNGAKPKKVTFFVPFALAAALCGVAQIYSRSFEYMPARQMMMVRVLVERVAAIRCVKTESVWHEIADARGVSGPVMLTRRDYEPTVNMLMSEMSPGK